MDRQRTPRWNGFSRHVPECSFALLQHADPRKILAKLREDYPHVVHRASRD
jgi:hypothetical protein